MIDVNIVLEKFPTILEFLKAPKRKYEIEREFKVTKAEAELIIETLALKGMIENSSVGWKAVKEVEK